MFISSCASTPNHYKPNQFVGAWILQDYGSGPYEFSQIGFLSNGRKCVMTFEIDKYGPIKINYYDNTWKVEKGFLVTTTGKNTSKWSKPGVIFKDKIISLSRDKMNLLFISEEDSFIGREEKHVKFTEVTPERICEIVEQHTRES